MSDVEQRWRRLTQMQLLGLLSILGLAAILVLGDSLAATTEVLLFIVFGVPVVISSVWIYLFECPRCHGHFHFGDWGSMGLRLRCVHCHLPRGADPSTFENG